VCLYENDVFTKLCNNQLVLSHVFIHLLLIFVSSLLTYVQNKLSVRIPKIHIVAAEGRRMSFGAGAPDILYKMEQNWAIVSQSELDQLLNRVSFRI